MKPLHPKHCDKCRFITNIYKITIYLCPALGGAYDAIEINDEYTSSQNYFQSTCDCYICRLATQAASRKGYISKDDADGRLNARSIPRERINFDAVQNDEEGD